MNSGASSIERQKEKVLSALPQKRVLHIASGDLWAGAERQVETIIKGLKDIPEFLCRLVVLNEGELAARVRGHGVAVTVLNEQKCGFFELRRQLQSVLRNSAPDLIHSHRYKENLLAASLKRPPMKLVQTVHGLTEPVTGLRALKSKVTGTLNEIAARARFDVRIAVSQEIGDMLEPKARVVVVRNGINLSAVKPSVEPAAMRESLGIRADEIVVCAVGRLVPVKGLDRLIEAAAQMGRDRQAVVMIAGSGPEREMLEAFAAERSGRVRTLFLGERSDPYDVINASDIFALSSHHEGIPMVLLEAMTLAKPVIAFGVGGICEVVEHRKSGVLIDPNDVHGLASGLKELAGSPELCARLGQGARERVEQEFSDTRQLSQLCEVYRSLTSS